VPNQTANVGSGIQDHRRRPSHRPEWSGTEIQSQQGTGGGVLRAPQSIQQYKLSQTPFTFPSSLLFLFWNVGSFVNLTELASEYIDKAHGIDVICISKTFKEGDIQRPPFLTDYDTLLINATRGTP